MGKSWSSAHRQSFILILPLCIFVGVIDVSVSGHVPIDGKAMTALSYANGPGGLLPGYNRTDPANEATGEAEMISVEIIKSLLKMVDVNL